MALSAHHGVIHSKQKNKLLVKAGFGSQVNHSAWRHAIAGGNWSNGSYCGCRTLNTNGNPWNTNGNVGVRGVSDAIKTILTEAQAESCAQRILMDQPLYPGQLLEHQKQMPRRVEAARHQQENFMGKRYQNLIEQIADWDNLLLAYEKTRAGKRARVEVKQFHSNLWLHLGTIQNAMLSGTYKMGDYRRFVTFDPKRREILAAPFGDRVAQHAIMNIVEPIWDKCLIDDTFACRKDSGTHSGADRVQRWVRDMAKNQPIETIWIVKTDYSKYFQNIRHDDLKRIIRRKITCARTLLLLDEIIDSTSGDVGIPVGNLTSQWLANLLGGEIDQWVKREYKVKRYIRYMDDIVAIFSTHIAAKLFADSLRDKSAKFGLKFSHCSIHRASQGINFLGYRIWPTHRLLRRRAIVKFRRDIIYLKKQQTHGLATQADITKRIESFTAHAKHADTYRLRKMLFGAL